MQYRRKQQTVGFAQTCGLRVKTSLKSGQMASLQLENIGKNYGSFSALENVNLDIQSGEFICLLGPSGCGKTTLLRIIAGLEDRSAGTIDLDGADLSNVPCHKRGYHSRGAIMVRPSTRSTVSESWLTAIFWVLAF